MHVGIQHAAPTALVITAGRQLWDQPKRHIVQGTCGGHDIRSDRSRHTSRWHQLLQHSARCRYVKVLSRLIRQPIDPKRGPRTNISSPQPSSCSILSRFLPTRGADNREEVPRPARCQRREPRALVPSSWGGTSDHPSGPVHRLDSLPITVRGQQLMRIREGRTLRGAGDPGLEVDMSATKMRLVPAGWIQEP